MRLSRRFEHLPSYHRIKRDRAHSFWMGTMAGSLGTIAFIAFVYWITGYIVYH